MAAEPDARSRTRVRQVAGCLFGASLCVYLATTGGSFATDVASYEVTKSLVERGSVAMSYNVLDTDAERGADGRYYAPVGLGHPLFGVPFYAAARYLQDLTGVRAGKPDSLAKAAVVMGSALAAAGCVLVTFLLAWRVSSSLGGAVLAALSLAFGTGLWPYAKFGFNAPLAAACLVSAVYWVWCGTRDDSPSRLALGGCALGYALLTRHELMVAAVPLALWIALESRARHLPLARSIAFGIPVAAALGVWVSYNLLRFGHPLDTGLLRDPNVRFDTPLAVGLHGLLASPGRSLFLYNPVTLAGSVAFAALARRDRATAGLFVGIIAALLPLYAALHQWDGGESYGPRYLVPLLPFLVIPIATVANSGQRAGWWLLRGCLAVSVAVQVPGVLVDFSKVQRAYAQTRPDYSIALTRYTWEAAPLVLDTKAAIEKIPRNLAYLAGRDQPPPAPRTADEGDRDFSQRFAFSLDFWWLYLYYLGVVPAWLAVASGSILVTTAGILLWRVRRLSARFAREIEA